LKNIQEIIVGCQKEQPHYQKALVEKYADLLYTICVRYLKDRQVAKDILQECLMRIFKAIHSYDSNRGSFEAWIKTITIRHCLKQLDKKSLLLVAMDDKVVNELADNPEVYDSIANKELLAVISELPEGYRQVFNLSVLDGYSHKEIGNMLGLKEASARSRLSRAKAILRLELNKIKKKESWTQIS